MNGFWLSRDPIQAAKLNRDSHVVATCREMAIMVHAGLAHHLPEDEAPEVMYNVYGPQSKNNSIAQWAGASRENWKHAFDLVKALNYEYVIRDRKDEVDRNSHASWEKTLPLWDYRHRIPHGELSPPPCYGPEHLKPEGDYSWSEVEIFYRTYYREEKVKDGTTRSGVSEWSNPRSVPVFMKDVIQYG